MQLSQDILDAVTTYASKMQSPVDLVLHTGEHSKKPELVTFLDQIANCSDKINFIEQSFEQAGSPVSFTLLAESKDTGIQFSGLPGGHEFNSFILALLHAGKGADMKLDTSLQSFVSRIDQPLDFRVFVSLSCQNCPDVVQTLNQFALLNPNISVETIDGALFPELIEQHNIQGVPSVLLNGQPFANGKVEPSVLIEKLSERFPELIVNNLQAEVPTQDVTVLGGGPAGVSAAIYAARKGLKVSLIAERLGGQVKDTQGIENFISVPQTTGSKLTQSLAQHLADYDVQLIEHVKVNAVEKGPLKRIQLSNGQSINSKTLIVATGAQWRKLNVPGEEENIGNGVAYCPHCDGPFFKGKDVAVIGGGNSGVEAALDLAGIVKSVTLFEFLPELKADKVLVDQLARRDNIKVITNAATTEVIAKDGKVAAIAYQDRQSGEQHQVPLAGIFVQIGLLPNSQLLEGVVELSGHKEVVINEKGETSEPGIFAAGDVTTVPYKQIVIAAGEGAKASLSAFEYLLTAA